MRTMLIKQTDKYNFKPLKRRINLKYIYAENITDTNEDLIDNKHKHLPTKLHRVCCTQLISDTFDLNPLI